MRLSFSSAGGEAERVTQRSSPWDVLVGRSSADLGIRGGLAQRGSELVQGLLWEVLLDDVLQDRARSRSVSLLSADESARWPYFGNVLVRLHGLEDVVRHLNAVLVREGRDQPIALHRPRLDDVLSELSDRVQILGASRETISVRCVCEDVDEQRAAAVPLSRARCDLEPS